jgi:periplasmic protein TonB
MTQTADKMRPFLATSALLHVGVFGLVVFGPVLFKKQAEAPWGDSSIKGITVGVRSSLPGIPLPSPPVVQETAKPSDTKTLHPADLAPKPQTKTPSKPAEVKIPERGAKTTKSDTSSSKPSKAATPPPPPTEANVIPGPAGGQNALPYGQAGVAGQATFGGDGTFGTRFPAYVKAVNEAIRQRWNEAILSTPRASQRVAVSFTIGRAGKVADLAIADSSGLLQLDNAAKRAVQTASFPPLPSEFRGSSVDVRFYFDYTR